MESLRFSVEKEKDRTEKPLLSTVRLPCFTVSQLFYPGKVFVCFSVKPVLGLRA